MMIRDVKKVLTTKQYFTGSNAHILRVPRLHREAIWEAFKAERVSELIEDVLLMMIRQFNDVNLTVEEKAQLMKNYKSIKYS